MAMLDREPSAKSTDLAGPLGELAAVLKRRGLVVLISDLLAPAEPLATHLGYLRSRGHDVVVLRVLDPSETAFAFQAPAMFRDVESGREMYVDPEAARADYRQRFTAHAALIERACSDLGVDYSSMTTDRPLDLVLLDFLKSRESRGARPGRRSPSTCRGGASR
jgi:uncharacterized protein (DUF58 family)